MPDRTLLASTANLLARGYLVVPIDRRSPSGEPVNALFAVARSLVRAMAFKAPARAIAVLEPANDGWPEILRAQVAALPELLRALGFALVEVGAGEEVHVVASYTRAAIDAGDDVIVAGVDKRYAQLVGDRVWWYDANKDVRYRPEIVEKRFAVGPAHVAEWLALVGDDSGNEVLPGVKGIGAKGATGLLQAHGSIEAALANVATLEGRLKKALDAAGEAIGRELVRARLDRSRALPVAYDDP
jgi:DNA polymerase-1